MVKFLVQNGARVNVVEETGDTPVFMAAIAGSLATVKYFVEETDLNLDCIRKNL